MIVHPAGAGEATIKIGVPRFRVEFWERPSADFGWNLEAWELDECHSVRDALAWTEASADGRPFTLYAVLAREVDYLTYVLLAGTDPNVPTSTE